MSEVRGEIKRRSSEVAVKELESEGFGEGDRDRRKQETQQK